MIEIADDIDFDSRQLCSDGNCTGVIGDDGHCKTCGRAADGTAAEPVASVASAASPGSAAEDGTFDDDRRLCPDGACVGLLGDDGKCKVCGLSAS
jgi:hypothetical protein